jgi:hypothetical protein
MGKGNFRPPAASKPKTTPPVISFTPTINRLLHGGFIALGLYYLFASNDPLQAAATLGSSLAFDPFDPNVPWKQRPLLQKLWLLAVLATTAALLGAGIGRNDAA